MIEIPREFYFDPIKGGEYDGFQAGVYIHTKIAVENPPEHKQVRLKEHRIKHQKTREFNGFTPIIRNYGLAEGKHISGDGWAYNFPKFTDLNNAGHPPDENFVGVPNLEEAFRLLGEEAEAKDGVFYKPHFIYPAGREKINELERLHL